MKKKTFDCVEMKKNAALRIHEQLNGMSVEEKVAYWRKRHDEIRKEHADVYHLRFEEDE